MSCAALVTEQVTGLAEALASRSVAVVVAHPDDEVLGCGALLMELRDVRIIHVTDGAPRGGGDAASHGFAGAREYAAARRREAEAALAVAGLPAARLTGLGVADQEVSLDLAGVTRVLVPMLADVDVILTHAYEGGHSDHDGVSFAVHAAHRLCARGRAPDLFEMPFYYGEDDRWIRQRFLPHQGAGPEIVSDLSPGSRARKVLMLEAHRTQTETLRSFTVDRELFRRAPRYDFDERPHDGPLLYERHGWNLTWPRWRSRVEAATAALGLDRR